ncbi:MAG: PPOX class F420-dependent oxidoreductase [Gammaproteobacteria bacterium]|nr:PPOX class F420-dependent oxidoreductase [Gammaproteobacteria bacterium]
MASSLDHARYFSLATFRKNGNVVATPVWFAQGAQSGTYFVFSAGDAGKVKRLRRSDQARVAACDGRGRLLGDWLPARAHLVDQDGIAEALAALRGKYGWLMWATDGLSRLSGRFDQRAYIHVTLV